MNHRTLLRMYVFVAALTFMPQLWSVGATVTLMNALKNNEVARSIEYINAHPNFDVNQYHEGQTLLHVASHYGQITFMNALFARGADINARVKGNLKIGDFELDGATALHIAIINDQIDAAAHLIACNADVQVATECRVTALHLACNAGFLDIMKLLVGKNADLHATYNDYTLMQTAALSGRADVIEYLADTCELSPNLSVHDTLPPIYLAIWAKKPEAVKALIKKGAQYKQHNKNFVPIGHFIFRCADFATYKAFFEATGYDQSVLTEKDISGCPAICEVKLNPKDPIFIDLLEWVSKEILNIQGDDGITLLHSAIANYPESVELLLAKGIDPFIPFKGKYATHLALSAQKPELFTILFNYIKRARPEILLAQTRDAGNTIAHIVALSNDTAMLVALDAALQEACITSNNLPKYLRTLLQCNNFFQIRNHTGNTCLDMAIGKGHILSFHYFISKITHMTPQSFFMILNSAQASMAQMVLDRGFILAQLMSPEQKRRYPLIIESTSTASDTTCACNACGKEIPYGQVHQTINMHWVTQQPRKRNKLVAHACDIPCLNSIIRDIK